MDNQGNEKYGRIHDEQTSGHWLYTFLRRDPATGQSFLVAANLHPNEALTDVHIQIPEHALEWLGGKYQHSTQLNYADTLGSGISANAVTDDVRTKGLVIESMPAKSAFYLEIKPSL